MGRYHYVFPEWSNVLLPALCVTGLIAPLYVALVVAEKTARGQSGGPQDRVKPLPVP